MRSDEKLRDEVIESDANGKGNLRFPLDETHSLCVRSASLVKVRVRENLEQCPNADKKETHRTRYPPVNAFAR